MDSCLNHEELESVIDIFTGKWVQAEFGVFGWPWAFWHERPNLGDRSQNEGVKNWREWVHMPQISDTA